MVTRRPAAERGRFDFGWLDTRHTFSFGRYHDPVHMGFGPLRVINDDLIAPARGFDTHPHRDMEIVSIVLDGALEHRDSLGTHGVIRPGEVQRMTAGAGIRHSEFNPSPTAATHLLQIWIEPREPGLQPGYEQRAFDPAERRDRMQILASPDGREGSVTIQQDALLCRATFSAGRSLAYAIEPDRGVWLHVIAGRLAVEGVALEPGDGAAVRDARAIELASAHGADVLLFDLPMGPPNTVVQT